MLECGYYNADCMEHMREYPDNYFGLAIVDPPYGLSVTKMNLGAGMGLAPETSYVYKNRLRGGGKLKDRIIQSDTSWDLHPPTQEYFAELMRVSKNQIIWGG